VYWSRLSKSESASGVNRNLRLDGIPNRLSLPGAVDCPLLDLLESFRCEVDQLAAFGLLDSGLELGAESFPPLLLFFQQAERLPQDGVGIRVLTGIDPVPDLILDLGSECYAHRKAPPPTSSAGVA